MLFAECIQMSEFRCKLQELGKRSAQQLFVLLTELLSESCIYQRSDVSGRRYRVLPPDTVLLFLVGVVVGQCVGD